MLAPTTDLDLSVTLFGDTVRADDRRTDRGSATVPSRWRARHREGRVGGEGGDGRQQRASVPLAELMAERDHADLVSGVRQRRRGQDRDPRRGAAAAARRSASPLTRAAAIDWTAGRRAEAGPQRAGHGQGHRDAGGGEAALQHGVQGIIVSNYGRRAGARRRARSCARRRSSSRRRQSAGARRRSFRRGTDILKALAFGAQGGARRPAR